MFTTTMYVTQEDDGKYSFWDNKPSRPHQVVTVVSDEDGVIVSINVQ